MELKPVKMEGNMAFMFETSYFLRTTNFVMNDEALVHDRDYYKVIKVDFYGFLMVI